MCYNIPQICGPENTCCNYPPDMGISFMVTSHKIPREVCTVVTVATVQQSRQSRRGGVYRCHSCDSATTATAQEGRCVLLRQPRQCDNRGSPEGEVCTAATAATVRQPRQSRRGGVSCCEDYSLVRAECLYTLGMFIIWKSYL